MMRIRAAILDQALEDVAAAPRRAVPPFVLQIGAMDGVGHDHLHPFIKTVRGRPSAQGSAAAAAARPVGGTRAVTGARGRRARGAGCLWSRFQTTLRSCGRTSRRLRPKARWRSPTSALPRPTGAAGCAASRPRPSRSRHVRLVRGEGRGVST